MRFTPSRIGLVLSCLIVGSFATAADSPIQTAINKGAKYLKGIHSPKDGYDGGSHGMGTATLAGMALLESGVPADDPSLQTISKYVHENALNQTRTYEVSLVIMFLDRLGLPADRPIIQLLGVRLMGGQNKSGGWSYECGYGLNDDEEARLKRIFQGGMTSTIVSTKKDGPAKKEPPKIEVRPDLPVLPKSDPKPNSKDKPEDKPALHPEVVKFAMLVNVPKRFNREEDDGDNSNTQFATLGLWIARKHGVPCDGSFALLEQRYRTSQDTDGGWSYKYRYGGNGSTPAMTCAGLIAFATVQGITQSTLKNKPDNAVPKQSMIDGKDAGQDPAVTKALKCLGNYITQAKGMPPDGIINQAKRGKRFKADDLNSNLYFLWSLERVAVIFGLETIGNHDWYVWGADALIDTQQANGSWNLKGYHGAEPDVNTSFALLFLNRANIAKDLAASLKGKVRDPGVSMLKGGGDITNLIPKQNAPIVEGDDFEKEAARLSAALIVAEASARPALLKDLRDNKGSVYTEALARAASKLNGEAQKETRDALARRLMRMTVATLRDMLKDADREIRLGAATAGGYKADKQIIPDLIEAINDADSLVMAAARSSLMTLSGKDFGPELATDTASKARAIAAWKAWWKTQTK